MIDARQSQVGLAHALRIGRRADSQDEARFATRHLRLEAAAIVAGQEILRNWNGGAFETLERLNGESGGESRRRDAETCDDD